MSTHSNSTMTFWVTVDGQRTALASADNVHMLPRAGERVHLPGANCGGVVRDITHIYEATSVHVDVDLTAVSKLT